MAFSTASSLARVSPSRAHAQQVGVGADDHADVAVEALDPADAERAVVVEPVGPVVLRAGDQRQRAGRAPARRSTATGPDPGPAAAVGGGEGLVQVDVDHVHAHVARAGLAHDGVEVGPVVVAEGAGLVDQTGDLEDVLLEEPQGVGVGEHDRGRALGQVAAQGLEVDETAGRAGDLHHA